jgi:4-amino-4-deoxychorismate lyase
MPLLVETIRADDGRFENLKYHHERMWQSRRTLFGLENSLESSLLELLDRSAGKIGSGRWKVRVLYDSEIRSLEAGAYQPKPLASAALVDGRGITYTFKTADRSELDEINQRAVEAGADTALIVSKGFITDFPYANAAFYDGRYWWTPEEPLLAGTRRARLLADGLIRPCRISPENLKKYISVSPVNAMLELGEIMVDIGCINREVL